MTANFIALPLLVAGSGAYIVSMESSSDPQHRMRLAYPVVALQADAEGDARFEVQVDKEGRPANCKIISSSGHPALDTETCTLMMQRGKWHPATAPDGQPTEFIYSDTMKWRLDRSNNTGLQTQYQQDTDYPAAALALGVEGVSKVELAIDEAGNPKSCKLLQSAGHPDLDHAACNMLMGMQGFRPRANTDGILRPLISVQSVRWKIPRPASENKTRKSE
ncbi:energy transducer TonB [Sphingopyxis sp. FD7]|jgi:TonB family protein|uniref:energy transducer TonB n=1 Tax=Sphingopyxis sp. FD7 TaxID=1914525 RepID=UPI000DC61457|nr:energy transducer TonB [Sphingopyxis sp. FD7]BBB12269.1 TonB protein [Sphingopyxis sp. FD7]